MTVGPNIVVRAATPADRDGLRFFLNRAARDENIDVFDILGFVQDFMLPVAQIDAGQVFVATRAWSIVGVASVVFRHDGEVELDALLIDPLADPDVTGGRLCDLCLAFTRASRARALHTLAKDESEAFLLRSGFQRTGTDELMPGTVALRLRAAV